MVKTYYEQIDEEVNDFMEYWKEDFGKIINENIGQTEDEIFEEIYQEFDLNDKIHEFLDNGWFSFLREEPFEQFNSELTSCAFILDESDEVETDSGLWSGQEPKQAIQTQAFFTVRNDLYFRIEEKVKELIKGKKHLSLIDKDKVRGEE